MGHYLLDGLWVGWPLLNLVYVLLGLEVNFGPAFYSGVAGLASSELARPVRGVSQF